MSDEFMEIIAREAVKSPIVTNAIASMLRTNTVLVQKIAESVDAELAAKYITKYIQEALQTGNSKYAMDEAGLSSIAQVMKRANELAAHQMADQMVKDMETA